MSDAKSGENGRPAEPGNRASVSQDQTDRAAATGTSTLEWAVAGFGALLLVAVVGYLGVQALDDRVGPPAITLAAAPALRSGDGWVVKVTVRNDGFTTAAGLGIEGTLMEGEQVVEEAGATLDYVPKQSEEKAGLVFSENPARYRLELRARGYAEP